MKQLLPILFAFSLSLSAQQPPNRDQLIEALMQAPDEESLTSAIANGKKAGLPEQMFIEARFISLINKNDTSELAALAPILEAQLPNYSPDDTMIFAVKEDFESILYYTKALAALQQNNTPLFKKHITEAYWLSPSHGTQFAPHINAVRLKEAMSKVTLDLERTFEDQKQNNQNTSLKEIIGDSSASLIHFWSPWIQPSLLAMPEFNTIAKILIENKIPVTSFLLAGTTESRKDADDYLIKDPESNLGHWLIDTTKSSLASTLRIASFPTVVLINKDGTILFNGDPADTNLWEKLSSINPNIKPPTANPVLLKNEPEEPPSPQKISE